MGVERGTISITIDAPMSGHGRDACVSLHVNDADRYYREWREKVEIKNPPRDEVLGRADVQRARSIRQYDLRDRPAVALTTLRRGHAVKRLCVTCRSSWRWR